MKAHIQSKICTLSGLFGINFALNLDKDSSVKLQRKTILLETGKAKKYDKNMR